MRKSTDHRDYNRFQQRTTISRKGGGGVLVKKKDNFRLALSVIFISIGMYMNQNAPLNKGTPIIGNVQRVFQSIPDDSSTFDSSDIPSSSSQHHHQSTHRGFLSSQEDLGKQMQFIAFSKEERRESLVSLGNLCVSQHILNDERRNAFTNPVLEKYDDIGRMSQIQLMNDNVQTHQRLISMQEELWKFCVMGSGYASTFVEYQGVHFLETIENIFDFQHKKHNYVIVTDTARRSTKHSTSKLLENDDTISTFATTSIISLITKEGTDVAKLMVETLLLASSSDLHQSNNGQWLSKKLYRHVQAATKSHPNRFVFLKSHCIGLHVKNEFIENQVFPLHTGSCAIGGESPCCEVTEINDNQDETVLFLMNNPMLSTNIARDGQSEDFGGLYVSAVSEKNNPEMNHFRRESSAFEIFLENDCLPSWQCHVCFIHKKADDERSPCDACATECKCYCQNICRIRPQPNYISKQLTIHLPGIRKDATRLIPRIIHQTYFEPITKEKYPNFSRLVSSWKLSGWDYKFYDDVDSAAFLDKNFAPEVREAYDSIIPGAYKADFFRLCVLLINGGMYADVDVELTSDLDALLEEDDVAFIIPIDEPGRKAGNGSCLWNGMIGASPGHPFIAKALEMAVNQIRNRFTAVDMDNMLCGPSISLDHSHQWDLLYLTGPCLIGAAINKVLGRGLQSVINPGDLAAFEANNIIQGRTVILSQNKEDMGWHRFTWLDRNLIVAGTDCPDYDDRVGQKHYSDKQDSIKMALFGTKSIYRDFYPKREDIKITIQST